MRGTAAGVGAAYLTKASAQKESSSSRHFLDLLRGPDQVTAFSGLENPFALSRSGIRWTRNSVEVQAGSRGKDLPILVSAPQDALTHLHLRWNATVSSSLLCMGDAWERSYGELAWRTLVPERVMPWYFSTWDGTATDSYGVMTATHTMCFWQLDPEGVSLWLNLSNGGSAVRLGDRSLLAATIVTREGQSGEEPIEAVRQFCRELCPAPRLPSGPIYGSNDWYYAYGNSSQELILRDADLIASLRPTRGPKPFTVIDAGWTNKTKFPDMNHLASEIRQRGVRPGIWERLLEAPAGSNPGLLLPGSRFGEKVSRSSELAYDPTEPDALHLILEKVTTIRSWGYELLKHDYSTYDLLGQFGFEMGASPTLPGWSFHDRSKTNAEIILDFYRAIRRAAGDDMLILGCTTVGHLGAGIFESQRTGDDTSGKLWERTRRMGVNTLAFRMPQHGTFFALDADCVAITEAVPWRLTQQWLDVVARSGTSLFISPAATATGAEQKKALAEAFALATSQGISNQPKDWFHSTTPEIWIARESRAFHRYQWNENEGAYPFSI
jgi:alpha-galactosidase